MKTFLRIFLFLLLVTSIQANAQVNKPTWSVDPAAFEQGMDVTIQMFFGATAVTSGGMVGAFINGSLVGVKDGGKLGPSGKWVFITRINGNSANGKTVTFKFWDTARDRVYDVTETLVFAADAIIGSAMVPQVYHSNLFSDADLSDLAVDGTTVTGFDPAVITYTVKVPKGTVVVPTVTGTTNDTKATKVITAAVAIPGSTTVVVTAENGTTTKTYTVNFEFIKNTIATLSDLLIDGTSVTGFDAATLTYNSELPHNTSVVPTVTATLTDPLASKVITPAASLPGTTTVEVTAEDGTTKKTYSINFTIAKDTDATLSDLKYNGTTVTGFSAATLTYDVELPHNTTLVPTVTATTTDINASKVITPAASLPGTTSVEVTAEDGTTKKTYSISFTVAKDTDATLSDLKSDGTTVTGFIAATVSYDIVLPHNTTLVPTVTATTNDVNASKVITPAASLPGSTTVEVTAEDGTTKKTYTINYTVAKDTDAKLSDLKSDGTTVTGFSATTLSYDIVLAHNTSIVPTVTATTNDVNASKVITPAASLPGSTTVEVTAEDGTTKQTYTINYTVAKDTDANLSDLKSDGTTVTGFIASTLLYNIELPHNTTIVPTVTATTNDVNASKVITPAAGLPGTTTVEVTAEDGTTKKTYSISYTVAKDTDATLSDLKSDGTTVTGFSASTITYDIVLAHNTTIVPTVTATTTDVNASKVITPAASLPGSTTVVVTAEDGTTKKTYTVNYTVAKDTDAKLSDLKSDGTTVTGFSATTLSYDIVLAHNTTIVPTVTATTNDVNATKVITPAASLPGSTSVVVTAEDGTTILTYTINYTVAKDTDAKLSDLKSDGTTVTGFSATTLSYDIILPHNTSVVPTVTATTNDVNATKVITPAASLPGSTTVVVTAEDGTTILTYTINYTVAKDTDATLSDLKSDGTTVTGFAAATVTYNIILPHDTSVVPTVTATTNDVNASKVITPAASLPGSTTVEVTAEDGTTKKTYTINYTVAKDTDAKLSDLKSDGTTVTGFDKDDLSYDIVLPKGTKIVPTVTATTNDVNASKVITPAADLPGSTTVEVTAEDGTTKRTYTINYTVTPYKNKPDWAVVPSDFTYDGDVIAQVLIDNVVSAQDDGILAGFVGAICRGLRTGGLIGPSGKWSMTVRCYSNLASGETIEFNYFDPVLDTVLPILETIPFESNMRIGSALSPFMMHAQTLKKAIKNLNAGWTWFSLNLENTDMTIGKVLEHLTPQDGDYIKDQTLSSTYYSDYGIWFGDIEVIDPKLMYKIKKKSADVLEFSGYPIYTPTHPISINKGWTWIGFLPQTELPLSEALASIVPADNDYIKNQLNSTTYYADYTTWFGELDPLTPLDGFMLKTSHTATLIYPSPAPYASPRMLEDIKSFVPENDRTFKPEAFEFSGQVTVSAVLQDKRVNNSGFRLYSMVGDQIRGESQAKLFEPTGEYVFNQLVYSSIQEGDKVHFRLHDINTDVWYSFEETLVFKSDMVVANAIKPFVLKTSSLLEPSALSFEPSLSVWPNPASSQTTLSYTIAVDQAVVMQVIDYTGRVVDELNLGDQTKGEHQVNWDTNTLKQGVYFLKMKYSPSVYKQVVITR